MDELLRTPIVGIRVNRGKRRSAGAGDTYTTASAPATSGRFRHPEDPGVRTVRLAGRVCASLARVVPGLNDQALFLTTLQRSIASRRGARYSSGVPTLSRNERVLSQSASPSPFILLQAFSRSRGGLGIDGVGLAVAPEMAALRPLDFHYRDPRSLQVAGESGPIAAGSLYPGAPHGTETLRPREESVVTPLGRRYGQLAQGPAQLVQGHHHVDIEVRVHTQNHLGHIV